MLAGLSSFDGWRTPTSNQHLLNVLKSMGSMIRKERSMFSLVEGSGREERERERESQCKCTQIIIKGATCK